MPAEKVNPYIKLLFEWKQRADAEHESGAFVRQYKALKTAPAVKVDPVRPEPEPAWPEAIPLPRLSAPINAGLAEEE